MKEEPQTRLLFVIYITDGDSPPKSSSILLLPMRVDAPAASSITLTDLPLYISLLPLYR